MSQDKIHVKLLTRLAGIGKEWEIVLVSRAQARNFLIPKGLAKAADEKLIESEKEKIKRAQDNRRMLTEKRHEIAETLHGKTLEFSLRGTDNKVFGGISEHEIAKLVSEKYAVHLERQHILLPEGHHIKKIGDTDIKINLGSDTYIRMTVRVSSTWTH